jgi:glycosyltransferase involved in cell wall biosynthesis
MRILHVINSLLPSGAERHLANLLGPLAALGVENHLVTFLPGNGFEEQVRRHVRRAALGVGRANVAAVMRMAREVDVVHTQLHFADVVGRAVAAAARVPSVTTFQSSMWAPENRAHLGMSPWGYHARRLADGATARLASRCFAVSSKARRAYVDGLRVPAGRVQMITNSVDLAEFDPAGGPSRDEARRALGFAPEEFAVVALARLLPLKALDDAVRAVALAAKVRPVRLVVAGEGPDRARLQAVIDETGAPAALPGRLPAVTALKAADLFVLPSRYEGMPLSLLEAMAMGVPALCSDIAETRETGGDAAVYAPVGDPAGYARALLALCDDPARREALARAGVERAREYSADVVARRFLDGVEGVLRGRAEPQVR